MSQDSKTKFSSLKFFSSSLYFEIYEFFMKFQGVLNSNISLHGRNVECRLPGVDCQDFEGLTLFLKEQLCGGDALHWL